MRNKLAFAICILGISVPIFLAFRFSMSHNTFTPKPRTIPSDTSSAIAAKIQLLCASKPSIRSRAALDLGSIGPGAEAATPWLIDLLEDEGEEDWMTGRQVCSRAAYALRQIGGDGAFKELVICSMSDNPTVREHTIWAFANNKSYRLEARAAPYVYKLLKDSSPEVRTAASRRLEELSGKNYGDDIKLWTKWWVEYEKK